jgi:hypothetical protein
MRIYNAIQNVKVIKEFYDKIKQPIYVLISYYYLNGQAVKLTQTYKNMIESLYLDSGAYSAAKSGVVITTDQYGYFLKNHGHHFDQYFNLDDQFDNPYHNWENQVVLENQLPPGAKKPIPVVHDKDAYKEFESYVDLGYDYIAFGSNTYKIKPVLDKVKENHPKIKIHLFGTTSRSLLMKYKPDSADSAGFIHNALFGSVYYLAPNGKEYNIYLGAKNRDPNSKKGGKAVHINNFPYKVDLNILYGASFNTD